jgi:hypothetical protein
MRAALPSIPQSLRGFRLRSARARAQSMFEPFCELLERNA